jgi:hypothetical protein
MSASFHPTFGRYNVAVPTGAYVVLDQSCYLRAGIAHRQGPSFIAFRPVGRRAVIRCAADRDTGFLWSAVETPGYQHCYQPLSRDSDSFTQGSVSFGVMVYASRWPIGAGL